MVLKPAILVVLSWLTTFGSSATAQQVTNVAAEKPADFSRCASLQNEIKVRYGDLRRTGTLAINQQGNDISDIFFNYIKPLSVLGDAESFLRECGFAVYPRPGQPQQGSRPDRYDVYASSQSIIPAPAFGVGIEIMVLLRPATPDNYAVLAEISAYILATAL